MAKKPASKPRVKRVKKTTTYSVPVVTKRAQSDDVPEIAGFPLKDYSYSSFTKFSTNPFMFKVNNINGETIETVSSAANVLGSAMHKAMRAYLGGDPDVPTPADPGEAIKHAHAEGLKYLDSHSDGFIQYNTLIENRTDLLEKYAFCFFGYIKACNYDARAKEILFVEKQMRHKVEVDGKVLPIPLKGYPDVVYRDLKNLIVIDDHKFTSKYSDPDTIDASKLVQAAFLFFLVYAETGEAPDRIYFREFKTVPNKDKSPQVREYEMIYAENPLIFDLFFRLYQDVTDALLGKQVFIPNFNAMYDKEVAILAYIHRLDVSEERARRFKELKVDNITDFLKKRIQKDSSMKRYLETVAEKFISASTLNYKDMKTEEKIKMKLAEHGLGVEFFDKIVGGSVVLYRYEPSVGLKMSKIEAYAKDIEIAVERSNVRILAPIPDSGLIGFEVPNEERTFLTEKAKNNGFNLAIGVDIMGRTVYLDPRQAPHILIAGTTGSGKSISVSSLITQLNTIPNARMVLIDPKMVELSHFSELTNVLAYVDKPKEINDQLRALVVEMDDRYKLLKKAKARNISEMKKMPYIFVVIDEYGDLISSAKYGKDIRESLLLLGQKSRAAGIHVILTTQRPSVKIIDGDIKANFPVRIAFQVFSAVDSHVVLDQPGAEKLLGAGDMLLKVKNSVTRLQGFNL